MKISGIYKIQSIIKPKRCYIGSAVNISDRWWCHLSNLKKNRHHSSKLQNHYNKYGQSDLQFSILLGCDKEYLIVNEQFFIDSYKPYFNINPTAGSRLGTHQTEESNRKNRESNIGKPAWNKGVPLTEEHKAKLRCPRTKETCDKISDSKKGNIPWNKDKKGLQIGWNKNIPMRPETKLKLSIICKGRISGNKGKRGQIAWNKGTKGLQTAWNKGLKHSDESKEKMSKARIGTTLSEETKNKISDSLKKYYLLNKN